MTNFQRRGNHVIALTTGGAFLGVLLAEIPGAILVGAIALIYAIATMANADILEEKSDFPDI